MAVGETSLSVCATTPAHTISDNGSAIATIPASTNCVTTTVPTVTTTVTSTITSTVTTTTGTTTTTPSTGGTPGIGIVQEAGGLSSVSNPNLYSVVVASTSDAARIAAVAGRGLVYFAAPDVNPNWNAGVTYQQATANNWLLKNSSGAYLKDGSNYIGDVGSSGYQQQWISNVLAFLASYPGVDGVWVDNVVGDPKQLCGGYYPALYPTTSSWSAAMLSFTKAISAALEAKGYYVAVNANEYISGNSGSDDGSLTASWWNQLGPYVNALTNENYTETAPDTLRPAGTSAWNQHWEGWQKLIGVAQGFGDAFYGMSYGSATDTTAMTYGKASFLLEWNGGGGSAFFYNDGNTTDPTNAAWTTDIGTPSAAKFAVGVGWERAYSKGTVLVNPSPSTSQSFTVNGVTYTLAPTTARILS